MKQQRIGIVGLGYVGLPLSIAFAAKYPVIGYDINAQRVNELQQGIDSTHEMTAEQINAAISANSANGLNPAAQLQFTANLNDLRNCSIYIVTVPTPVDTQYQPDLSYLLAASQQIGSILKQGDIVVYESTVYPGCTEEACVPELSQVSGLQYNTDFLWAIRRNGLIPEIKPSPSLLL
jgi:UDP-N-acetyl-D-galactosamine dehydrogenase